MKRNRAGCFAEEVRGWSWKCSNANAQQPASPSPAGMPVLSFAWITDIHLDGRAILDRASHLLSEFTHMAGVVMLPRRERVASVRIGVLRDKAFTFYYPENLEALRALLGA